MKVEITDYALSKNLRKLINKLIKTANKYSKFNQRKFKVDISFVDEEQIRTLNREQRHIDKETDVLSFPTLNLVPFQKVKLKDFKDDIDPVTHLLLLGDIIICESVAKRNAEEYGHSLLRELSFLAVHGFYHLLGYDHQTPEEEKIMFGRQEEVLDAYGIRRES